MRLSNSLDDRRPLAQGLPARPARVEGHRAPDPIVSMPPASSRVSQGGSKAPWGQRPAGVDVVLGVDQGLTWHSVVLILEGVATPSGLECHRTTDVSRGQARRDPSRCGRS
jgi:hypothetical protein